MKLKLLGLAGILFLSISFTHANDFTKRIIDIAQEYNLSNMEVQSIFTDVISEKQLSPKAMENIHTVQNEVDKELGIGYRSLGPKLIATNETITKISDDEVRCGAPKGSTVFEGEYALDMPNGMMFPLGSLKFTAGGKLDKNIDVIEIGGNPYWIIYQYDSCSGLSTRIFSYNRRGAISETPLYEIDTDEYVNFTPITLKRLTHTSDVIKEFYLMIDTYQSGLGGSYKTRYGAGGNTPSSVQKYIQASENIDMVEVIYEENRLGVTPLEKTSYTLPPTDQPVTLERNEVKKDGSGFSTNPALLEDASYLQTFSNGKEVIAYEFSSASASDLIVGLFDGDSLEKVYTHVIDLSIDASRNLGFLENYLYDEKKEAYTLQYRIIDTKTGKTHSLTEGDNCLANRFYEGFGKDYFFTVGYDYRDEVPSEVTVCFYDHQGNYKKSFLTETTIGAGGNRYSYDVFGFVGDTNEFYTRRYSDAIPDSDVIIMFVDIEKNPMDLYPLDSIIINSGLITDNYQRLKKIDEITNNGANITEYLSELLPQGD